LDVHSFPTRRSSDLQNKIRVCNTVFKWPETSKELQKRFPRPADLSNSSPVVSYGPECSEEEIMLLRRTNASLGKNCEVHLLIVLFNAQEESPSVVTDVLNAWQGPNKNELVFFIGLNNKEVKWIEIHSWINNTTIHSLLVQNILQGKKLDIELLSKKSLELIPKYWERKKFEIDFEYLSVSISKGWFITSIISSVIISTLGIFIVENN